jgi:hypothetical protein
MPVSAMAYLDESGDLGWKLDNPYLNFGSSRYFVIAIVVGMNNAHRRFGKVMGQLHKQQNWTSKKEKKWGTINELPREIFCQLAAKELAGNDELNVMIAVFHKESAPSFLRDVDVAQTHPQANAAEILALEAKYKGRAHLVYAMMVAETLAAHLPVIDSFAFCPDELNGGQRALDHILTYRLLIQDQRDLTLNRVERVAAMDAGLIFADMCAGAVFEAYERGVTKYLDILKPYVVVKEFMNIAPKTQPAAAGIPGTLTITPIAEVDALA